jgi:hypothetical protein
MKVALFRSVNWRIQKGSIDITRSDDDEDGDDFTSLLDDAV